MLRILSAKVFARPALAALFLLVCSSSTVGGREMKSSLLIGKARIDIVVEGGGLQVPEKEFLGWVQSAAESVSVYFGHFPVPQPVIRITPFDGRGIRHGMTFGEQGGRINIRLGNETSPSELASDWMLTHEMVHLAFPSMREEHHWIEEGIATYVEPIARVQAGHLQVEQMWFEVVRDLPQGLPQAGDQGLDHTHTWGRTYWGGALFCLLADVEIRRQTNNAKGLQQALRGILDAGGDIRKDWSLEEALKVGDHAACVSILQPLYTKMKDTPMPVDLEAFWKQLGIRSDGSTVHFDDTAPLAAIRRAITTRESSSASTNSPTPKPHAVFAGRSVESR
jgi:hypothetical protein